MFTIYGCMAGSGAWKMFLWIFQDFTFYILKSQHFWKCWKSQLYVVRNWHLLLVSESPSRVRLCPSCLRRFGDLRKKHAPGYIKPPGIFGQIWPIWSNDYANKTCIKILCKKPVPMPRDVFSRADFFGNFGNDRTLGRMSTWTILGVMPWDNF